MRLLPVVLIALVGCATWDRVCVNRGGTPSWTNCRLVWYVEWVEVHNPDDTPTLIPVWRQKTVCDRVCRRSE